jgi:hypothetical protein
MSGGDRIRAVGLVHDDGDVMTKTGSKERQKEEYDVDGLLAYHQAIVR